MVVEKRFQVGASKYFSCHTDTLGKNGSLKIYRLKAGLSIRFEVGVCHIIVGSCDYLGGQRPLFLGGSGGMLPQKILKFRSSEMRFPAFLA